MHQPMFPVPIEALQAELEFTDFEAGDSFNLGDVRVVTVPLRHPNGATGYRIEYADHAFAYVTDTEHIPGRPDENVLRLIADADLVAYPSTYEGFGLPVLEAMQAGTPVLAADAACLPEVVGDAGILLPTGDTERWAVEIITLLDDADHRARLAAAGAVRATEWAGPDASGRLVDAWRDVVA
jgi:glycosyltransferase involved in cell wall biosynthesis